ncbi:hypothetical protein GYMLUDRAFT_58244 [Collybiopsis luxurians FD-317 M1]|uniref:F-box domain-containing protein n=1 Tax=Collybiopsis luxurians FD-317 M1 TaxID=944289 RepID=A0A0D0CSZ3_9AGAR|nr:hypothetical protein GYMLUDRAFT_58244 [Collybiopsis luxurians FD-317 M1]
MFHRHSTTIATGILNLNALDARNQHLLSLENKQYTVFPCGLPAELWNIIIDYLHDDRQSLSACLSAYRAWGNFCRYHIYENFIWNAQNAPSSVDRTDPDSECNVSLFHPCPQYVRHLTINGGFTDDELLDVDWLLPLACRLDIFQSVTHLEVESVDWDDIFGTHAWDTFLSAHNFLSRIKYLDLYNVPLQPFQYILDSICLFPALEKLDYLPSHVDCDNEEDVDHELYQPPSKWRILGLAFSCIIHVPKHNSLGQCPRLRSPIPIKLPSSSRRVTEGIQDSFLDHTRHL